jgi:hypothetical protein
VKRRAIQRLEFYLSAKESVIAAGYASELDAVDQARLDRITEQAFLVEAAWVVLCSGFRESTVTTHFNRIGDAFRGWKSAKAITENRRACIAQGLRYFRHPGKITALADIAETVAAVGIERVRSLDDEELVEFCASLPFVGPVTSRHLARNLGADIAKPDRHLKRLADDLGYVDVQAMCQDFATLSYDRVAVVDAVLWRYRVLQNNERVPAVRTSGPVRHPKMLGATQ